MLPFIQKTFFKIMKGSGFLFILGLIFSALGTGQAEISYTMFGIASVIYLIMLIVARYEGRKAV